MTNVLDAVLVRTDDNALDVLPDISMWFVFWIVSGVWVLKGEKRGSSVIENLKITNPNVRMFRNPLQAVGIYKGVSVVLLGKH